MMDRLRFLLSVASSQNPSGLREAEAELRQLETQPQFHIALLTIVADRSIDLGVRLQAVLYLKNGIDRYWRKQAPNAISEPEKTEIRRGLLLCFGEPAYPVALQIAVVVAKAARFDVPKDWPELLPSLLAAVQCEESVAQHRALLLLHHTVKALSTKRLAVDRKVFHDLIEELLPHLLRIWTTHHSNVIHAPMGAAEGDVLASLEKALLAMKILRKSVVLGLRKPDENPHALELLHNVIEQIKVLLTLRSTRYPSFRDTIEKYIVLHLKFIYDLLETQPFSFLPVMKSSLHLVCSICFASETKSLLFRRCAIFCLNILKQVLTTPEYKLPRQVDSTTNPKLLEADKLKREFFDQATVNEICKGMISTYLPLSRDDLELWDADPEQYACEEGGDSWRYSFRPCCETAFLTVFHEYRDKLAPTLVEIIHQTSGVVAPDNLPAILHKDAVYNAVGLAAFDLYDEVDFDQWLINGIAHELAVTSPNYRIIRRRAVWLIGQWSGVKLSPELRPRLYQLLLPLLDSNEDLVVRLSAAKALRVVIDDFEFSSEEMKPYLNTAFTQLFLLLKEVEECDTKLGVLNVLSYLIERVGVGIRDICQDLVHYLPCLWEASVDHNMLRCSILSTLVFIAQGLGTITESLAPFLYSVIHMSTDLSNSSSVYLLEDGLELWLAVLHNSKQLLPHWLELTKNIPQILELGSENLRTMIYIIQAYILLEPNLFLTNCGEMISNGLQAQYSDLQDEGVLLILRLVDLIIKVGPTNCPAIFKTLILHSFKAIYDGESFPMLMSMHLSIASRILLKYSSEFNEFIGQLAIQVDQTPDFVAGRILDVWLDRMACVTQSDRRKLLALGLTSLIASGSPVVLARIYAVFLNVTEVLNDIIKTDDETHSMVDCLQLGSDELVASEDVDFETEHDHRKRHSSARDIVHTSNLRDYFQSQVAEMAVQIGKNRYDEILQNVDVETLTNMKEFIVV